MRVPLAIAALVLALLPAELAAEDVPRKVELGESTVAGWKVRAWIDVENWDGENPYQPPWIGNIPCEIEQEQELSCSPPPGNGGLWFRFTDTAISAARHTFAAAGHHDLGISLARSSPGTKTSFSMSIIRRRPIPAAA